MESVLPLSERQPLAAACEQGELAACVNLGVMYRRGYGGEPDAHKAAALYEGACRKGNRRACSNLGFLYSEGEGVQKDTKRGANLFQLACDLGDAEGCRNLGETYRTGDGRDQDDRKAVEYFTKSCTPISFMGCNDLAFMYQEGKGVAKDVHKALRLYQDACEAGVARGCSNAAFLYDGSQGIKGDEAKLVEFGQKGCAGGDEVACQNLASFLVARGQPGDQEKARQLLRRDRPRNDDKEQSPVAPINRQLDFSQVEDVFATYPCTPKLGPNEEDVIRINAPEEVLFTAEGDEPLKERTTHFVICGTLRMLGKSLLGMGIGGSPVDALTLVAVNARTGTLYSGPIVSHLETPIEMPEELRKGAPPASPSVINQTFNPNLVRSFELPAIEADYDVQVVLGSIKSNGLRVRLRRR